MSSRVTWRIKAIDWDIISPKAFVSEFYCQATKGKNMQTKITLDLEGDLIQQIEAYAREKNKSISQIVTDYLQEIARQKKSNQIPPVTQSLIGILKNHQINEDDYKQHLTDKYL